MLKKEDIEHLATLSRMAISEEEKGSMAAQLDSVLSYVSELSKVVTKEESAPRAGLLRNVMREDADPYPGGEFTDAILENAPHQQDGYLKVGQIF